MNGSPKGDSTFYDQAAPSPAGMKRRWRAITAEMESGEVGAGGKQIPPEMPAEQSEAYVEQAGQYSGPGGLEMEMAAPTVLVREHVAVA